MPLECDACGAEVLDIDVRCDECGHRLSSTGAQRMLGSVVLGQYEIIDILGQGGMSVVYKGRHKLTDQEVALKILPPELAAHSQVKSRFLDEAKALAALDHPNIVHLYNFGQEAGCFVLAMQFVRGATFERMILESDQLHWALASRVCIDVLKALEYAHNRGIIHRDMKPSNILVREDGGSATVMDFGIAKMTTSTKLTATGQTMGTVRYMSPEQVRGLSVDARTDIYSLGGSLYEAVVGDTPFDGETHFEIMTKHLNEPPVPPSAHGVEVPASFEHAVMRALAKNPEDRWPSAKEMREALEASLQQAQLGEAETLRMTRDFLAALPSPAPTSEPVGLASRLEPTGVQDVAAGTATPGRLEVGDQTDLVVPLSRKPALWIGLSLLVVAASVSIFFLLPSSGDSRESNASGNKPPDPAPDVEPSWPEPFALDGLVYKVDKTFERSRFRVMSVKDADPLRFAIATGNLRARFTSFLRRRGHMSPVPVQPMTLQLVPLDVLCQDAIYAGTPSGTAPPEKECKRVEFFYRDLDKTLFVSDASKRPLKSLAYNIGVSVCFHTSPPIEICTPDLLDQFAESVGDLDEPKPRK